METLITISQVLGMFIGSIVVVSAITFSLVYTIVGLSTK